MIGETGTMFHFSCLKMRLYWHIAFIFFIVLLVFLLIIESFLLLPNTWGAQHSLKTFLLSAALSMFVTFVVMWILTNSLLKPLNSLKNNLLLIANDPLHPEKYLLDCDRKDELGLLNYIHVVVNNVK